MRSLLCLYFLFSSLSLMAGDVANEFTWVLACKRATSIFRPAPGDFSPADGEAVVALRIDDLISYDAKNHLAKITPTAAKKLSKLVKEYPVFVVYANGKPVYSGEFWSMIFSVASPCVVMIPYLDQDEHSISINLGYPSQAEYKSGTDPRSEKGLIEWFKSNGKLLRE